MTDRYHAFFHIEAIPDKFVETAIERCVECGFDTRKTGGSEYVQEYETADYDHARDAENPDHEYSGDTLSDIATEITESEEGTITLWYDGVEFKLTFHLQPDQEWHVPRLDLKLWRWNITPDENLPHETAQDRLDHFIQAITALATEFDAEFAYCDNLTVLEHVFPEQRPIVDEIDHIPWVTVLSEHLVEEFGGYERVLATPAWRVEELDTGHVLIVRQDNPVMSREDSDGLLNGYLLERKSIDELRDEKEKP